MKKNILLTNLSFLPEIGGVENSLRHISSELKFKNYNPIILCGGLVDEDFMYQNVQIFKFKRCKYIKVKYLRFLNIYLDGFKIFYLSRRIHKLNPISCIIARNSFCAVFSKLALRTKLIFIPPAISVLQDNKSNEDFQGSRYKKKLLVFFFNNYILKINLFFENLAILISTKTIVFSKEMLKQTREYWFLKKIENKFLICPPGVDVKRFKIYSEFKKKKIKKIFNLPNKKIIALIAARLVKVKNIELAIKSLKDNKKIHLIIVGDGPHKKKLQYISNFISKKNISFFPKTLNIENFFGIADIFLMPSYYESFGQTLIEANACGLKIVGLKSSRNFKEITNANNEIIKNINNGILHKNSISSMKKAINVILDTQFKNEYNKKNMQSYIKNKYNWSKIVNKIIYLSN